MNSNSSPSEVWVNLAFSSTGTLPCSPLTILRCKAQISNHLFWCLEFAVWRSAWILILFCLDLNFVVIFFCISCWELLHISTNRHLIDIFPYISICFHIFPYISIYFSDFPLFSLFFWRYPFHPFPFAEILRKRAANFLSSSSSGVYSSVVSRRPSTDGYAAWIGRSWDGNWIWCETKNDRTWSFVGYIYIMIHIYV